MNHVKVHRTLAVIWVAVGVASFVLGAQDSVVLVWIASVYANVMASLSAAEAADDRTVVNHLKRIEARTKPRRRR